MSVTLFAWMTIFKDYLGVAFRKKSVTLKVVLKTIKFLTI